MSNEIVATTDELTDKDVENVFEEDPPAGVKNGPGGAGKNEEKLTASSIQSFVRSSRNSLCFT